MTYPVWLSPDPARQAARMRQERRRIANRRYYEKNRDRMKARARAWDAANPERRREINREWARENMAYLVRKQRECRARRQGEQSPYGDKTP